MDMALGETERQNLIQLNRQLAQTWLRNSERKDSMPPLQARAALKARAARERDNRLPNRERVVVAYKCITCQDTGVTVYDPFQGLTVYCQDCEKGRDMATDEARFHEEMQAERKAHLRRVNRARLDAFTKRHKVQLAPLPDDLQQFLDTWDGEQGLWLVGPLGVGKTWRLVALAEALMERAIQEDWSLRIATVPDYLNDLRGTYDAEKQQGSETYHAITEQYRETHLLILDDLGKERPSGWVSEQFFNLINYRYNKRLPLFISSNLIPAHITTKDESLAAVVDRLKEMCKVIVVGGESLRGKQGGK